MSTDINLIKTLRERTGAGVMDCRNALTESEDNLDQAEEILKAKGTAKALKRSDKETREGIIATYIHNGSQIGALVELNCETDFVARTEDFQKFAKDVAMHVAAERPVSVAREDVDEAVVAHERSIYLEQAKNEGKPEHIAEKIVEGKLTKFFKENKFENSEIVKLHFLDFFGYSLYHLNKIFFKEETYPTTIKIFIWDKIFTPFTIVIDYLTRYKFGKNILCIYQKNS